MAEPRLDIYISVDIETDGPVPSHYSMLSIGLCVAGTFDGREYRRLIENQPSLYLELKPVGTNVDLEALRVNGLDREKLSRTGIRPDVAMPEIANWVESVSDGLRPILVAYPLAFDWPFVSWYFNTFGDGRNPFGHSSCLDIRSLYVAKASSLFEDSGKHQIPRELRSERAHTHNALDDAMEQADLFSNIFEWRPTNVQAVPG